MKFKITLILGSSSSIKLLEFQRGTFLFLLKELSGDPWELSVSKESPGIVSKFDPNGEDHDYLYGY